MKEGIHPKYEETTITCACGNVIKTRSTKKDINGEGFAEAVQRILLARQLADTCDAAQTL